MRQRMLIPAGGLLAAFGLTLWFVGVAAAGQASSATTTFKVPAATYTPPKTPWGDPDLQGVWDNHSTVPLERPARLGDKKTYTDEELANMRGFRAGSAGRTNTASSVDQLDRVRAYDDFWGQAEGVKDNRTAEIEYPANGRIPPLTPAAKAAQEAYLATHPSTDEGSGSDVTHWDGFDTRTRCIAIQVPAGVMSYNSASYIMQSQGWVMIALERLNTRMIPLDGRPHSGIRSWQGDSVGHWEGNTLVVETINFLERPSQGGGGSVVPNGISQGNVRLIEHFVPVGPKRLEYYATLEDSNTWTQPWTFMQPWEKDPVYSYDNDGGKIGNPEPYQLFEYACHEGNRSIGANLKSANDRLRAAKAPKAAPAAAAGAVTKPATVATLMGQTEADIRAKFGAPLATVGPRWQYGTTGGVFVVFVFFEDGKVVRVRPDDLALDQVAKTTK
jgi:hypothetical protein